MEHVFRVGWLSCALLAWCLGITACQVQLAEPEPEPLNILFSESVAKEFATPPSDWREGMIWLYAVGAVTDSPFGAENASQAWQPFFQRLIECPAIDLESIGFEGMACAWSAIYGDRWKSPLWKRRELPALERRSKQIFEFASTTLSSEDLLKPDRARCLAALAWLGFGLRVAPKTEALDSLGAALSEDWLQNAQIWIPDSVLAGSLDGEVFGRLGHALSHLYGLGPGHYPERYEQAMKALPLLVDWIEEYEAWELALLFAEVDHHFKSKYRALIYSEMRQRAQAIPLQVRLALLRSVLPHHDRFDD